MPELGMIVRHFGLAMGWSGAFGTCSGRAPFAFHTVGQGVISGDVGGADVDLHHQGS